MGSPTDRFSRLEKVAIFLIALGQERARQILQDLDLDTVERLNAAIRGLGPVSPAEKAAVMLDFARFFYGGQPIPASAPSGPARSGPEEKGGPSGSPPRGKRRRILTIEPVGPQQEKVDPGLPSDSPPAAGKAPVDPSEEERAILNTLEKLRQRLDPGQIDWGRAGYDFGEGFKGPADPRR